MMAVKTFVFLKELLSNRLRIPFGFVFKLPGRKEIFEPESIEESPRQMVMVKDVPDYLGFEFSPSGNTFQSSKIKTLEGYYVALDNFEGYNDYLRQKIGAKRRSNLRKYLKRLEHCLDIRYTVYYGAIDQQEYYSLFKTLREFLIRRFAEKKEVNYEIPHLGEMEEIVYDLILQKKASLFVIYHNQRPISIRINMFYNDLAFYIISGYDIDYSAFHVGTIDMLKNIEWCFQSGFTRYDLLKGYFEYKRYWITHRYYNHNHLIYTPSKPLHLAKKTMIFATVNLRYRFLELSRQLYVYQGFKKLKRRVYNIRFGNSSVRYQWMTSENDIESDSKINVFGNPEYNLLRRPVYDYLFHHKERLEDISVFTLKTHSNGFLIKGKNSSKVLLIK